MRRKFETAPMHFNGPVSRPQPTFADGDARVRHDRLMAAWEVWRRDSDASLALSEAEDAARCSDTLPRR